MPHPSRIFTFLLLVFIAANAIFFWLNIGHIPIYWPISLLVLTLSFWRINHLRIVLLVLMFVALSFWRTGDIYRRYQGNLGSNKVNINIEGTVDEETKVSGSSQQIIFKPNSNPNFRIQITTTQFPKYGYGSIISVKGEFLPINPTDNTSGILKLKQITGRMSYPEIKTIKSESNKNLLAWLRYNLIGLRTRFESVFSKIMPEPQAGLISGILLGTKADLNSDILSLLSRTGTTHIIALSGYNITIVAAFVSIVLKNRSRRWSFWIPALAIILFVLATGLTASAIRAAIMGILLLAAKSFGRQSNAAVSILFASALMISINPFILVYDVGFQLSFAAVSGIIFFEPIIENMFAIFGKNFGPIFATTLAAQLFTWPITSYYFGTISLVASITNLLILPIIPLLMLIGFVVGAIGFVSLWLAQELSFLLWLPLSYIIKVVETFGNYGWSAMNYQIKNMLLTAGYYLLLADFILIGAGKQKKLYGKQKIIY